MPLKFGSYLSFNKDLNHELRTPREEVAFTALPKIQSQSQIFRHGRSIFCLPHRPNFSDIFDIHWVSVVRDLNTLFSGHFCLQYARHYKPRLVYFLPHFSVAAYIVERLILQTIYVLNMKILQFLGLKSAVYNQERVIMAHVWHLVYFFILQSTNLKSLCLNGNRNDSRR